MSAKSTENASKILCSPRGDACSEITTHALVTHSEAGDTSYFLAALILAVVAPLIISLLGAFSNAVNCLVFYRQGLRDRMNLCLFSLSSVDFLFLGCSFLICVVRLLAHFKLPGVDEKFSLQVAVYSAGVIYAFNITSGLYIMVIAVERCVCVTLPLHVASVLKTRTTGMILATFAVVSQLGFICQPLKYNIMKAEAAGVSAWQPVPTQLWLNNREVIETVVYTIFSVSVPLFTFFTVSLATFITAMRLTAAMAWRQKTSSTSTGKHCQQVALTKTLVLASCVYIVLTAPFVLIKAVQLFVKEFSSYGAYSGLYGVCNLIAHIFPVINSSVHVFVYYSRSARYRRELTTACRALGMRHKRKP